MLALLLALVATPDTLDLSLADALELARRHSPARVQAAAARTRGGTQLARGILGLAPSVNATMGYGRSDLGPSLPDSLRRTDWRWTGTVTLAQVVFDPAVFAAVATGIAGSGAQRAEARDLEARLVFDVTAGYLDLLKTGMLRDAAAAALARARENLRVAEERERLGSATVIDLLRSRVFDAQAEIELLQAEKAMELAQATLRATVGLDRNVAVRPLESLPGLPGHSLPPARELLDEIAKRNPGLEIARRGRAVADINRAAAWGRALPGVSAAWSSNWSDSVLPSRVGDWTDNHTRSWGLQANFPLLDLKSWLLNLVEAGNEARRARAAARAAELQLYSTATAAVIGYDEARRTFEFARRNLELGERLHELALEQRRLGSITLADFFAVEADLARARASYTVALCDAYVQVARLNYLLGEGENREE